MAREHAQQQLRREKTAAARLSIYSNTFLTLAKLAVGLLSGSVGVLAEAVHSATDLLASWIAFLSVRVADRPADEEHPYGHGKVESLSGLAEALLIFAVAAYLLYEAVSKIVSQEGPHRVDIGLGVMALSVVMNSLIARHLFRVAHKTDSLALEADAEHLRTDVYTSLGVVAGLALVEATGQPFFDPLAAIVVSLMIVRAAWELTRRSLAPLMDSQLSEEEIAIVRAVLDSEPEVLGYHKLRTRKSGSARHVDAHVLMDDHLTLLEAHELTERLEDRIRAELPHAEVTLHTEPHQAEQRHQYEHHGGPHPDEVRKPPPDRSASCE